MGRVGVLRGDWGGTATECRAEPQAPSDEGFLDRYDQTILGEGEELLVHSFTHSSSISLRSSVGWARGHSGEQGAVVPAL